MHFQKTQESFEASEEGRTEPASREVASRCVVGTIVHSVLLLIEAIVEAKRKRVTLQEESALV